MFLRGFFVSSPRAATRLEANIAEQSQHNSYRKIAIGSGDRTWTKRHSCQFSFFCPTCTRTMIARIRQTPISKDRNVRSTFIDCRIPHELRAKVIPSNRTNQKLQCRSRPNQRIIRVCTFAASKDKRVGYSNCHCYESDPGSHKTQA